MSNLGATVGVTAPGELIFSASPIMNDEFGKFAFKSGTSMASPHVAGLAGLLLGQDPLRTVDDLTQLIATTADDLGDGGRDDRFGYGRVNATAALRAGQEQLQNVSTTEVVASKRSQTAQVKLFLPLSYHPLSNHAGEPARE